MTMRRKRRCVGGGHNSHVHQVCLMWRLMFDLWVDNGRVGDSRGMRSGRSWNHVMWEPENTTKETAPQRRMDVCDRKRKNMAEKHE